MLIYTTIHALSIKMRIKNTSIKKLIHNKSKCVLETGQRVATEEWFWIDL